MTGARITVDDAELQGALRRLAAAGLRGALVNIGEYLVESTKDRFAAARSPAGAPWAPLNPAYAAGKKGAGILLELGQSGGLMGSIVYQVDGSAVTVGSSKVYGAIHQFGGTIVPRQARALVFRLGGHLVKARQVRIPARPYLGISTEDRTEILAIIADHIAGAVRG